MKKKTLLKVLLSIKLIKPSVFNGNVFFIQLLILKI